MTRSRGFARISLMSARWLLPWIAVLFVSATLAYAMSSAIGGRASASDQQPEMQARSTTSLSSTSIAESCSGIGSGLTQRDVDWWIVAEGRKIGCNPAMIRRSSQANLRR
jgi:hypothetical protein